MKKFVLLCLMSVFWLVPLATIGAVEMDVEVGIELTNEEPTSNSKTTNQPVQKKPLRLPQTNHEANHQLELVGFIVIFLIGGVYCFKNREGRKNA